MDYELCIVTEGCESCWEKKAGSRNVDACEANGWQGEQVDKLRTKDVLFLCRTFSDKAARGELGAQELTFAVYCNWEELSFSGRTSSGFYGLLLQVEV